MAIHQRLAYPDLPFHGLLQRAATRWPHKTAIVFGDSRISYDELDAQVNQFGNALLALGVQEGDRIALLLPNCPEYEIAFFGSNRVGAIPTSLNPSYKIREVQYQVSESGAQVLVVHCSLWPTIQESLRALDSLLHVIVVGDAPGVGFYTFGQLLETSAKTPPGIDVALDTIGALPFSSGTTGLSKGVMLTQRNLVCNSLQFVHCTETTDVDVLLIFLPLYHIYGVSLMATAIAAGATQVLLPRFDLAQVLQMIREEGVTEVFVVPPVMLALTNAPDVVPYNFETVRFIMSAAAPLAPDIARRLAEKLRVPVIQAYGMTESSPLTHMVPLHSADTALGSVGVVAPDTHCRIVDIENGERTLAPGSAGEVVVAGPQVMKGYWNAPEATACALRDGWLYTGDIGMVNSSGRLFIIDRKKEMIKYKGFSIAPAELEAVLLEHPAVLDCAVTGHPDSDAGEVPHAYVVLRPDVAPTREDLIHFVGDRVATYKQICFLDFVDHIPRTPSVKILRRVLKHHA
ncbi:MAG: 4-coumarate--CoA ligase family protein [Chloroflexota bacterium]